MISILAYVGGGILAISSLPQVLQCYKNKSTKGLSMTTIFACIAGLIFNIVYAIATSQPGMYIPMGLSLALNACLVLIHLQSCKNVPAEEDRERESESELERVSLVKN